MRQNPGNVPFLHEKFNGVGESSSPYMVPSGTMRQGDLPDEQTVDLLTKIQISGKIDSGKIDSGKIDWQK